MKMRKTVVLVIGLFLALVLGVRDGYAQGAKDKSFTLSWGTTRAGGTWLIIGNAMLEDVKKENPNITGSCVPGDSSANPMGVNLGKINIGFGNADNTALAWDGLGPFEKMGKIQNIRNIAAQFPLSTHIVVRADSDIKKIEDLKGKRVSVGPKGFSNNTEFARLLKFYGMSYDDMSMQFLSISDAAQQFIDGHLDCLAFVVVPPPYPSIINAASSRKVRFLSIPDDKIEKMKQYKGVGEFTLPAKVYEGQEAPVKGIATRTHLMVNKDMPDWVVNGILSSYLKNFARYQKIVSSMNFMREKEIALDVGIPFHPAAVKFFKEKGLMK